MNVRDLFDEAADSALAGRTAVDLDAVRARALRAGKVHRRRQAATTLLAAAAVVTLVLGLQFGAGTLLHGAQVAAPAHGAARVPDVVYLPPAWTPSLQERPVARALYVVSALDSDGARPYAAAAEPVVVDGDAGDYRRLPWQDGDHDIALSADGTRAAWARDAGTTRPGEDVVLLTFATARTTTVPLPSASGQGVRVTSLTFSPDGTRLAAAGRDGVGEGRDTVWVRGIPDGDWSQVCACSGPLGWTGDGVLLVAGAGAGTATTGGAVTTDGVMSAYDDGRAAGPSEAKGAARTAALPPTAVRATPEATVAWSTALAPGAALGARVVFGQIPLTLSRTDDGHLRLRSADARVGADLADLQAPGAGPGAVRRDLVVGSSGAGITVSRTLQDSDGRPLTGLVQTVGLADPASAAALPVRTVTRVEGGRAVVVAAAQGLLDAAPVEAAAAAPQRGGDPDWWRYQARRAQSTMADGGWWWLALPALAVAVLVWRRRRDPFAAPPLQPRAALARYLDPRRARRHTPLVLDGSAEPAPRRRHGRLLRLVVCLGLVLSGVGVLVTASLGEDAARVGETRPAVAVALPEVLQAWGATPQARLGAADGATRRLSLLLTRTDGGVSQLLGLDAATGVLLSLEGLGADGAAPGLGGAAGPVAISPDGRVVAQVLTATHQLLVVDLGGRAEVRRAALTVDVGADSGGQGRLTDHVAVTDDGTVLLVTPKGALWRFGADGSGVEFKRFGPVEGVAAQPSGRFLLWRHFGEDAGPARLDLIDPIAGAVKSWMTWDQPGLLSPVAAEAPGNRLFVRTDDGRVVLHHVDAGGVVDDQVVGRMPQADWFGSTGDGSVITITAPDEALAQGASLAIASWTALGDTGRPDAVAATDGGGAGRALSRIDLAGARVAVASAVIADAAGTLVKARPASWTQHLTWAADDPWRTWLLPAGVGLVLAGLVWLLLMLVGPARRAAGRASRGLLQGRVED